MTTVFRLDRGTRERYAQLVRFHQDLFADAWGDIAPVEFATVAWRIATPPLVTGAAYVRWHRRVLSAEAVRNPWDGTLLARVQLVAPSPVNLAGLPPVPSATPPTSPFGDDRTREESDGAWRDWPNSSPAWISGVPWLSISSSQAFRHIFFRRSLMDFFRVGPSSPQFQL